MHVEKLNLDGDEGNFKIHNFLQEAVQNLKAIVQNCAKLVEYNDVEKIKFGC